MAAAWYVSCSRCRCSRRACSRCSPRPIPALLGVLPDTACSAEMGRAGGSKGNEGHADNHDGWGAGSVGPHQPRVKCYLWLDVCLSHANVAMQAHPPWGRSLQPALPAAPLTHAQGRAVPAEPGVCLRGQCCTCPVPAAHGQAAGRAVVPPLPEGRGPWIGSSQMEPSPRSCLQCGYLDWAGWALILAWAHQKSTLILAGPGGGLVAPSHPRQISCAGGSTIVQLRTAPLRSLSNCAAGGREGGGGQ